MVAPAAPRALVDPALERDRPALDRLRAASLPLLGGIIVWELIARLWQVSFLPPFSDVVRAAARMTASGEIIGPLTTSLANLAIGYGLAVLFGVSLGLLMGRYRAVEHLFDLYVYGFLVAPKIVFIPVLLALFGFSRSVQVAVIFLSACFVIVVNAMTAIRTVDPRCIEMARSFGASERQLFWRVLLPGALPLTMAGARLGMGRAIKGMIIGELFITIVGMGALLRGYGSRFDSASVFGILLIVVAVALVCSALVRAIELRLTHWAGGRAR